MNLKDFFIKNRVILFVFLLILLLSFGSVLFFPSDFSADKTSETSQKSLNVLNWTSYLPADVLHDFESETGIKINYGTYSSNEELLAKVSASKPGTYDLVFPSDYMVDLMSERLMLLRLDKSKLKNLENLNPTFLSQPFDLENEYSLPFLLATTVLVYDSEKLDSPVLSYKDLTRPELKNNIVLLDDERIMIGAMLNAAGKGMNDSTPESLSEAFTFFEKLRPNVKAFDSDSPKSFLITNEVDAGLVWNAEATLAQSSRPSLKTAYPAEGFALSMDNFVVLAGSKKADLAYLFIDYLLRDDVSKRIVSAYPYISPNRSAETLSSAELEEIFSRGS
ncbi:spermidine/putrescine ABC transporter substrate-binding protein [Candidatus Saccharibacteria bacterium]|nr:spermidine/putrescine ABC transporter substrate-binding protein [Candidatus Saccharibacteria bacterium]